MSTVGKPSVRMLVLDTSTTCGQLVLWHGQDYLSYTLTSKRHGEELLNGVTSLLTDSDLSLKDLDAVALVNGPGSLTGIRLACAVMQAFAWVASLPVVPLNALVALAWDRLQTTDATVLLDARMGHVFMTRLCRGGWQAAEMAARRVSLVDLDKYLLVYPSEQQDAIFYHGQQDTQDRLDKMGIPVYAIAPSIANLAAYAKEKWHAVGGIPCASLLPNYLAEWSPNC